MSWSDLYGTYKLLVVQPNVRHPFDANACGVALQLDETTVLVFENPDDGYRSTANDPIIFAGSLYQLGGYHEYIHGQFLVRKLDDPNSTYPQEGIEVVDLRNNTVIFRVGTAATDDYYPYYVCNWMPERLAENMT